MRVVTATCIILVTMSITGCGSGSGNTSTAMNAEFRSLNECMQGIKKNSGQSLEIITDTPSEVSGFLSNGQGFGCQKTSSGTKGTYFKGWYMVK